MRHAVLFSAILLALQVPALAAPALPAAANTVKAANFVRGAPLPKWAAPLPEVPRTERADPVVMRMADTQVSLAGEPAVLYSRAIQVNDQGALSEIGQYSINYAPAYQKLLVHKVMILRDGQQLDRTASVNMRSLEREQQLERGMYGGEVSLQMLMQDVRVGDTLWITYTIEGSNPVFGKRWAQAFGWDSNSPTELRRLVVTHPKQRSLYWRQIGDFRRTELLPTVEQLGAAERLTFTERAYDALDEEPSVPSDYVVGRLLQFSEYQDWSAVSQWAASLFPAVKPSPALKELAKSFESKATQAERAAAALHWVQNEVRYFSVSIGENSHRPQPPDTVLANRYGDCKDKSYLLVSLLGMLGIEARPVLVSAFSPAFPSRVLPSPYWFDHVIVKLTVNGKDYYVDPTQTGQTEELHELPIALAGGSGLVVDVKSALLQKIPQDARKGPDVEVEEDLTLDAFDSDATLVARRSYRGNYASWMRRTYHGMALANLKKHALEPYEKTYPGINLAGTPKFGDENGRFVVTSRFTIPKAATLKDKLYSVPFDTKVIEGSLGIPDKLVRNYPFAPAAGKYEARYRMRLRWPQESRLSNEPAARVIDTPHFRAKEEFILRGNYLDYMLDFSVKQDRVEAAELPELQAKAKSLNEFVQGNFRVAESSLLPRDLMSLSMRQYMPFALAREFDRKHEAVKDKKATDLPPAQQCDYLLSMYALSGSLPVSLAGKLDDMDGALKTSGARGELDHCGGFAQLVRGMYQESALAYRKLKGEDDEVQRILGALAELLSGNAAAGADIMQRFVDKRRKDGLLNGVEAGFYAALASRAGRAVPPEILADAAAYPAGPWPRPVLAMYAGVMSPEEVVAAAEKLPGDARDYALDEAWFHIGQLKLSRGDNGGAEKAFRWFEANGLRNGAYYIVARGELARLAPRDADYDAGISEYQAGRPLQGAKLLEKAAQRGFPSALYELADAYETGNGVPKDMAKAIELYQAAGRLENALAQNELGRKYALGQGVAVDEKAAVEWYRKAAQNGNRDGLYNLAWRYEWGEVVDKDPVQAAQLTLQSAELGHVDARARMANYYRRGFGVKQDYVLARYWAALAAQEKAPRGMYELGVLYFDGLGQKQDRKTGFELVRAAADKGYAEAQVRAGIVLENGIGTEVDGKAALRYFQLAAEQDDSWGMARLGRAYYLGKIVKEDLSMARAWSTRAAQQGSAMGAHYLAELLFDGAGGERDVGRAITIWEANAQYFAHSAFQLATVYHFGKQGIPVDAEKAVRYYQIAAEDDVPVAINNLGDMYENGLGVPKDLAKAVELYKRAAHLEASIAFMSLGSLFSEGLGVPRDYHTAYAYYSLAKRYQANPEGLRRALEGKLSAEQERAAAAVAAAWAPGKPLPGFNEASASPAGRE